MDLGLSGRVALVTASTRGLGLASAMALAQEGAKVSVCGRHEATLREAERELQLAAVAAGGTSDDVLAQLSDVTQPESPTQLVEATLDRFGKLDVLVANAGGPPPGRALEVDDAAIEAAVNANLLTSVRLVREALPHMRPKHWGRICCIASRSIKQPIPTLSLSNTARTGLWAWVKTAAADLAEEGITLNVACPGGHATERMRELGGAGRLGDPSDFGKVVAFLCSVPAAFVNGAAIVVDGGETLAL